MEGSVETTLPSAVSEGHKEHSVQWQEKMASQRREEEEEEQRKKEKI